MAYTLLGYALAGPVRLSVYFYARPFWDLLIDGVLILTALLLSLRWLQPRFRLLIVLAPFLALTWMDIEFLLYSRSEVYSVISYLFITLWGVSFAAFWKFMDLKQQLLTKSVLSMSGITFGLFFGYAYYSDVAVLALSCLYILLLLLIDSGHGRVKKRLIPVKYAVVILPVLFLAQYTIPAPHFFDSQAEFEDKVVLSHTTDFQQIDITEWKGNHWFYQDGINQFSSIDSWLYFEPFVHPAMHLAETNPSILIVGGENGMLARELVKYNGVEIDLIAVDQAYLTLSRESPFFVQEHGGVFERPEVNVLEQDAFRFLSDKSQYYDLIFVDVPDPVDVELNQYFTLEFYELCASALNEGGMIVTQSGSPYFATTAFQSIQLTMKAAGFSVQAYHNQVLTLGEWAWTIGSKMSSESDLRTALQQLNFDQVETAWLNSEAMNMMLSFGKPYVVSGQPRINTIKDPVIYRYYIQGNYQLQ
jgi:spermidine synthase